MDNNDEVRILWEDTWEIPQSRTSEAPEGSRRNEDQTMTKQTLAKKPPAYEHSRTATEERSAENILGA